MTDTHLSPRTPGTALVKWMPPVSASTVVPFALPDLTISDEELTAAIHREHAVIMKHVRATIAHAYRTGVLLLEVKRRVGHGAYGPWISANCPFDRRTAQRYTRLVRHWHVFAAKATDLSRLTFEQAMDMLTIPDRDEFACERLFHESPLSVTRHGDERPAREFTEAIIASWAADARRFQRQCDQLIRGAHGMLGYYLDPNEYTRRWTFVMTSRVRRTLDHARQALDQLDADVKALPPHDPDAVLRAFLPCEDAVSSVPPTDETQQHETLVD